MRVAVVGAGAVGSLVGGLLARAGLDVTLVGRPAHVEAIRRDGLRLGGVVGDHVVRPKAETRLTGKPDLTIFATKAQDLAEACRDTAPIVGDGPVVTMQNGVRCDRIARRFFAPEQIVGCVAYAMATFLEPGRVDCQVRGWLTLGDPFVSRPLRLKGIANTLSGALPVRTSRDIAAARWTKLIGNLNNALPAITGRPLQEIYFSPPTSRLPLRLMREGLDVLSGASVRIGHSPQALAMQLATRLPEPVALTAFRGLSRTRLGAVPMFGSTWQSVMRRSPTEIEHLNGEIVALGRRVGHPTPLNEHVVRLVKEVQESGEFLPPEKLWPR